MLLIYGVVRADRPDPAELVGAGEPGAPVHLIRSSRTAAAVSDVGEWTPADADAATYLDVLTALLDGGPVLPVAFGTVAPGADAVRREVLEPDEEQLDRLLARLDGLVEIRVEVARSEDAELRTLFTAVPRLQQLARQAQQHGGLEARMEIGEEISVGLQQRRDELDAEVSARLRKFAVADRPVHGDEVTVVTHAFLVRAGELDRFDRAVRATAGRLEGDAEVRSVGPLPAFDFLDVLDAPGQRDEPRGSGPPDPAVSSGRWGW